MYLNFSFYKLPAVAEAVSVYLSGDRHQIKEATSKVTVFEIASTLNVRIQATTFFQL